MKKILITMAAIFILIFSFPSRSNASMAVPLPAMPYVPPNATEFFDLIFNVFGATAANIQDDAEKLQAYAKLFQAVYGESWQSMYQDLLDVLNISQTSGYITFDVPQIQICNEIIDYAINNGVQYGKTWENAVNPQQVVTMLEQRFNIVCPLSVMQEVFNKSSQASMTNFGVSYAIWNNRIWFFTLNRSYETLHVGQFSNGYYYFMNSSNQVLSDYLVSYDFNNRFVVPGIKEDYFGGHGFPTAPSEYGTCNASSGSIASIQVLSSDISDALAEGEASVLTPFTDVSNPYISITINLPAVIPTPAYTVDGVSAVQDDLHIQTVDTDISDSEVQTIVEGLQESYSLQYGDINDFRLDLTEFFPFCIPFDIARIIDLFVADPEAPKIPWKFVSGFNENWQPVWTEYVVDLTPFDTVAEVWRKGLIILSIIGIALITRQIFLRG